MVRKLPVGCNTVSPKDKEERKSAMCQGSKQLRPRGNAADEKERKNDGRKEGRKAKRR